MKLIIFTAICVCLMTISQAANEIDDDAKKLLQNLRQHCLDTVKTPLEKLEKFNQRQYDDNDNEVKEHLMCIARKADFFDQNGDFQKKHMQPILAKVFGEEDADKIINECTQKDGDNVSENMWKYSKCAHKYWTHSYPYI